MRSGALATLALFGGAYAGAYLYRRHPLIIVPGRLPVVPLPPPATLKPGKTPGASGNL